PDRPIWRLQRRGNVWLPLFVGWSILSLALILAFPPLYRLVRLAPPSGIEWLSLGVAVLAMGAAVEVVKATLRPRGAARATERRHQEPRGVEP
ncbi:MAG: hypothetical protein IRY97_04995, partial [Thermomicrobiaceae bacterium]|nr:hypothetical protein [Thermomicrobiaceae bacterium]